MGGYIGATAVGLTTTAADVQGDITSTDTTPELILKNTSEEDAEGGREGKITFKGEQSGGEETTLAQIEASHDGTADDQKGNLIFKTNDGSDGASPTERLRIDSDGRVTITDPSGDAADGPILDIYRNSVSPADNDNLGIILFNGENDAGAKIPYFRMDTFAEDVSSGAEDGRVTFQVRSNGGNKQFLGFRADTGGADGEIVFNESQHDINFRIESDSATNLFFADAGANRVNIGSSDFTSAAQGGKLKVQNDVDYSSTEFEDNATLLLQNEENDHSACLVFHSNFSTGTSKRAAILGGNINSNTAGLGFYGDVGNKTTSDTVDMILTSSGELKVGTTNGNPVGNHVSGTLITATGQINVHRDGGNPVRVGVNSDTYEHIRFEKNGAHVGGIGTDNSGDLFIGNDDTGLLFAGGSDAILPWNPSGPSSRDNVIDLGASSHRFDNIYATNSTIQTSDRNEKQDIEDLSEAELRVATAAKGLIKKFRWIDAVQKKGDDARIHVGIIAQDLQAAFEAEGLDAGRYAMFTSDTWWEADRVVPAVEANEEEGIEAVAEHTVTDTFDTQEEAPEGATERTRLGVRYPELLAFIIGAM